MLDAIHFGQYVLKLNGYITEWECYPNQQKIWARWDKLRVRFYNDSSMLAPTVNFYWNKHYSNAREPHWTIEMPINFQDFETLILQARERGRKGWHRNKKCETLFLNA